MYGLGTTTKGKSVTVLSLLFERDGYQVFAASAPPENFQAELPAGRCVVGYKRPGGVELSGYLDQRLVYSDFVELASDDSAQNLVQAVIINAIAEAIAALMIKERQT